jgi:hypothetical protein
MNRCRVCDLRFSRSQFTIIMIFENSILFDHTSWFEFVAWCIDEIFNVSRCIFNRYAKQRNEMMCSKWQTQKMQMQTSKRRTKTFVKSFTRTTSKRTQQCATMHRRVATFVFHMRIARIVTTKTIVRNVANWCKRKKRHSFTSNRRTTNNQ